MSEYHIKNSNHTDVFGIGAPNTNNKTPTNTKPIYLDYNATTPIAPEVAEAMLPFLYEIFGNPSSSHPYGVEARAAVEEARSQIAELLHCAPAEIVFTSSGTESNNYAIRGIATAQGGQGNHIITSAVEHPAVSEVCRWLGTQGFDITVLPVDSTGLVYPDDLESAMRPETILVSIMHANNEVGTIQPIKELVEISHDGGAVFHTDAAQTAGKIEVNVMEMGVDLLSVAGHKLYAPKGIGALYIREGLEPTRLMFGAGHERGRRPGTENLLEISGLGKACQIATRDLEWIETRLQELRDRLHQGIMATLGEEAVLLNGHPTQRLPNTLSIGFHNLAAHTLLAKIQDGVAASAGSACHADQVKVSPVLEAMGVPLEWAMGTLRFSVGRNTSEDQIDRAIAIVSTAVQDLNRLQER
jgi:cysteine desulfurase